MKYYIKLETKFEGICALCKLPFDEDIIPYVDISREKDNKPVCVYHAKMMDLFNNDPATIKRAIEYVAKYK